MGSNSNSAGVTFRRIIILLWKNLIFRKRHYIVTSFEIILPTIFAVLMAYLKADLGANMDPEESNSGRANVTYFREFSQEELFERIYPNQDYCGGRLTIPFAPTNLETIEIMQSLENKLMEYSRDRCDFELTFNVTSLPFPSEQDVETFTTQLGFGNWEIQLSFSFAIIFDEGFHVNETSEKISYKLRFVDFELDTDELMPWFPIPGPNWGNQNYYRTSGFSGLQILLDKIIINRATQEEPQFNISTQTFPYPPYQNYDFANLYSILLPQFLVQGFIFIVPSILRGVVSEKQTGIKELMKMMGLPNWMHWVGWMLNSLIILVFSVTIVVLLFFIPFNSEAGAVLEYSDPSLWWVVLFLYVIAASAFCFFISSFFHKPTLATTVGVVLWLVSYYALSLPLDPQYQQMNLATKMSIAILPNMALHYSIKIMSGYEGQGVGAQWSNIGRSVSSVDPLCLWHMCVMFIVSTILYISLTMYIENVLPSKYGLRKPWYYIFLPSEWGLRRKKQPENDSAYIDDEAFCEPGFEEEPTNLKAGIEVLRLRKVFGKTKVAVNDVSIKFFDGQITALLGHNGAGKTTMMSILTGMFSPTSGTALVNGYDIKKDMINVRKSLGLCPQHNMLFDKLTVEEHLRFFGMLKGLSRKDAIIETQEIMQKMKINEKSNVLSMSLSGGQKRKVSLGCALIGGTKVVILDEPTSGMDIESRRALWDILLEMRGHRTIILTTHYMEEADVLGDRIAIMADGKLQCCGSPMFLKKFYGTGYSLKMVIAPESNVGNILALLQRHITTIELKEQKDSEVTFTIPAENGTQGTYPALFSDLNEQKLKLGIQTIGLSLTTMDEVFVKVGELHNHNLHKVESRSALSGISSSVDSSTENLHQVRAKGLFLIFLQFYALFIKKLVYTFRKRRLFLSQFIFPVLLVMAAILISNSVISPNSELPPLTITLSDYFDPITLYSDTSDENLGDFYARVVGSSAVETDNVSASLLKVGEEDIGLFRERYLIAAELNNTNMKAMLSSIPKHATPLSINMLSNTMLHLLAGNESTLPKSIEITNHPLKSRADEIYRLFRASPNYAETIPILFAVFMPIGLALLSASYIVFPIEERQCKAKQLQLMTGSSPIIYWGASFVWDYMFMIILICAMTACFPIFETYDAFTNNGGAGVAFLILFVYGFGAISFSYLMSLFISSVPGGFAFVTIIHITTGMIINLVVYGLNTSDKKSLGNTIAWFGRLFPTFGAAMSTMIFTKTAALNTRCNLISSDLKTNLCIPEIVNSLNRTSYRRFFMCCDNCEEFDDVTCFVPDPYVTWYDPIDDEIGIGQELLYMFLMGLVYKVILISIEYGIFRKILNVIFQAEDLQFHCDSNDDDVLNENRRVQSLISSGRVSDDAFVVENLCKSFESFSAVSKLSFGVRHGECFGLLGVNGAGKTTSFRMLTGDEIVSDGNAYGAMKTLKANHKDFLSNIGYCPQFDGIIGVLTGREMLDLFARLRGISGTSVRSETNKWLSRLGLLESADVHCENYSGGMKRRLSTAMAMMGDPPILMLDEPTTGVDPVARRELWKSIAFSKNSGQAIILTSHSMEECEALCGRLGIMVNGEMQCIGGVEHLKTKFAQGFCLNLKLKNLIATDAEERLNTLSEKIIKRFPSCVLKDQHQNNLQYQIYDTTLGWDVLFQTMENIKNEEANFVEEYSVCQTTLEEVFLSFARRQYPERRANVSFLKKLITCQLCTGCTSGR